MCICPKRILNRSNHFDESKPLYLTVPCGKCWECRQSSRNDWFVRCFFEWQRPHTRTFFYTLTYNNDNLPIYEGVPCFSKEHLQLFLKRLRYYLAKRGVKLRYLITCEFGTLKGRCHYHALFFCDNEYSPFTFYKLVEQCWQYGFVKSGDNFGVVNSFAGIKYVTKYITKDESHTDEFLPILHKAVYTRYNKLLSYIRLRTHNYKDLVLRFPRDNYNFVMYDWNGKKLTDEHKDYEFAQGFINKINSIVSSRIPFHLQSLHLGCGVLEKKLSLYDMLNESVTIMQGVEPQTFHLPRYFKRLFWYDVVENENDGKMNRFVLNDKGIRHQLERSSMLLEQKECEFLTTLSNVQHVNDELTKLVCDSTHTLFKTKYDLMYWMQHFDLDVKVLAIYSIYFRDRISFYDGVLNCDTVKDSYLDYAEYCFTCSSKYDYGKIYEKFCGRSKTSIFDLYTWNHHCFFRPYEEALQILNCLSLAARIAKSKAAQEKEDNQRKLRELLNKCST